MARPLKIFLGVLAGLLLLIVSLAIALPLMFDPNDYREQIAKAVKENTGREFQVGNIDLKVFPWLRATIADARLGNAPGFGDEPFAQAAEVAVGVRLLPLLFDGKFEVSTIALSGLKLNLQRNAAGTDNWSDIGKKRAENKKDDKKDSDIDLDDIDIAGIEIKDSSLRYTDAQANTQYTLDKLNLTTGALRPGEPFDLDLSFAALSKAPQVLADIELSGHVIPRVDMHGAQVEDLKLKFKGSQGELQGEGQLEAQVLADLVTQVFTLSGLKLDGEFSGKAVPGGKQKIKLTGALSLDQAKGTLKFSEAQLQALGLDIRTDISGQGIGSESPRLSGPLTVARFVPRELLAALGSKPETADKDALSQGSLSAQYSGTFDSATLDDLKLTLDQTTAQGRVTIRDFGTQAIEFALKLDAIDADRYLPPKKAQPAGKEGAGTDPLDAVRIPTEALEKLNASGTLDIGSLKINGLKMTDVRLKLSGAQGAAKQQDVSAKLYGGHIDLDNRISPGQEPAYAMKTRLTALDVAPFLKDFIDKDWAKGIGNITLDLTSRGDTVGALKRTLNGDVSMKIENGAVKGFNLGQILRKAQATLKGDLSYTEDAARQTDFSALSFAAKIVNGVIKSDLLDAATPGLRLAGSGEIDLVRETINYLARPTVVESSSGQGGKGLEDLRGLTIPIRITGNLFDPKYKLDLNEALKQKAGDELHQRYEKEEDRFKEKLRDKLGDLFGKPKQPPPAPTPAPAPAPEPPKPAADPSKL